MAVRALIPVLGMFLAAGGLFALTRRSAPTKPSPKLIDQWLGQRITALAVGKNGVIVTGDESGELTVFTSSSAIKTTIHSGPIRALKLHKAGLLSVSADGSSALWSGPWHDMRRQWRWRLYGGPRLNDGLLIGDSVVLTAERGVVARIDADGERWRHPGAHGQAGFALAQDGDTIWSVGTDGWIRGWAFDNGARVAAWQITEGWLTRIQALDDGTLLVAADDGRAARYQAGKPLQTYGEPGPETTAMAVDAKWVALGDTEGHTRLYARESGAPGPRLQGPPGAVFALIFDGPTLWSTGGDDAARRWRVTDGKLLATLR